MGLVITIETTGMPRIPAKERNTHLWKAMYRFAGDWHLNYHDEHFTPKGARKYFYAQRKTKRITTGTVRRLKNGAPLAPSGNPLEWSGRSRSLAKVRKIKATTRRSSVVSPIRVFNFWPNAKNPKINMRVEYSFVPKSELREISKRQQPLLERDINNSKARTHIRIT